MGQKGTMDQTGSTYGKGNIEYERGEGGASSTGCKMNARSDYSTDAYQ
jgi:hypothetical protein